MKVKNDFLDRMCSDVVLKHLQIIVEITTSTFYCIINHLGCRLSINVPERGFEVRELRRSKTHYYYIFSCPQSSSYRVGQTSLAGLIWSTNDERCG